MLESMDYGTYNELVNGVYKLTNITGGPHPVGYVGFVSIVGGKKKPFPFAIIRKFKKSAMCLAGITINQP